MSAALVQQAVAGGDTATLGAAPGAGNMLVVAGRGNITAVTGGGCTWVSVGLDWQSDPVSMWVGYNSSGFGTSIVATGGNEFNVSEFSGMSTTNPIDAAVQYAHATSIPTSASYTPTVADVLVFVARGSGQVGGTASNGFTLLTGGGTPNWRASYLIVDSPSGAYSTTFSVDNAQYESVICGFKQAAGGGGGGAAFAPRITILA